MKAYIIALIYVFVIGFYIGRILTMHNRKDGWTAYIEVTDRNGNVVPDVKPKSVVCLAERPNETLICRVESVR